MKRILRFTVLFSLLVGIPGARAWAGEAVPGNIRFGNGVVWGAEEPWNTVELRRAFLIGMTDRSPFLVRDETGFETFWQSEMEAAQVYWDVAQLYARSIGADPDEVSETEWKTAVIQSLEPFLESTPGRNLKEILAYLAGVYVRHGRQNGFRFTGGRGYPIVGLLMRVGDSNVVFRYDPGFPGSSQVEVSGVFDSNEDELPDGFDTFMRWIRAGVLVDVVPQAPSETEPGEE